MTPPPGVGALRAKTWDKASEIYCAAVKKAGQAGAPKPN